MKKIDLYKYEKQLYKQNPNSLIAGVDEVGRGPLVGDVVAACVILPKKFKLPGLTDSKKLTVKQREVFYQYIIEHAVAIGIGKVSPKEIDEINIYQATKKAMYQAIENLEIEPTHILIDAMKLDTKVDSTSIIKGDAKSISIAAASVIAKVTRDKMMDELDKIYPMYSYKTNKGYPTKKHIEALEEYGILHDLYRKTYAPIREMIKKNQ